LSRGWKLSNKSLDVLFDSILVSSSKGVKHVSLLVEEETRDAFNSILLSDFSGLLRVDCYEFDVFTRILHSKSVELGFEGDTRRTIRSPEVNDHSWVHSNDILQLAEVGHIDHRIYLYVRIRGSGIRHRGRGWSFGGGEHGVSSL
jgi:hypothetical protein